MANVRREYFETLSLHAQKEEFSDLAEKFWLDSPQFMRGEKVSCQISETSCLAGQIVLLS